ncbi:MAG: PKD domain-containing protein, partial [Candidatus Methanoperedens sp.]|nr:PKD domain-containing protein [Candidatus Methanoperedens sp.]
MVADGEQLPVTVTFTNTSTNSTSYAWDFGDSGTSTETSPVHSYTAVGTYDITLSCTGPLGDLQAIGQITITESGAESPLIAQFTVNPGRGVVPATVQFTDASSGENINSWSWDFGDGGTSTDQNPSHTYDAVGTYTITLVVGNAAGQSASATGWVEVIPETEAPQPSFTVVPQQGEPPLVVTVTDTSQGVIDSWEWDFGDGTTASGQGPHTHTYDTPGTYTIVLVINGSEGGGTATRQVVVLEPGEEVDAKFSYNYSGPFDNGQEICFTDQSLGNIQTWEWDFGDGGSDSVQSPCHFYAAEDNYVVTLRVTGVDGQISTTSQVVPVLAEDEAPVAQFTKNRSTAVVNQDITFTDQSTGVISSWLWDFGDGGTSTDRNPRHRYAATGVYTIFLTVNGPGGSSQSAGQTVTIEEDTSEEPFECAFSGETYPSVGQTVTYRVSKPKGEGISYTWTLDGAQVGTGNTYVHTWEASADGSRTVYVLVMTATRGSDSVSCSQSKSINVFTIQAWFERNPYRVGVGQQVCFTDASRSAAPLAAWAWNFGDGAGTSGE